MPRLTKNQLRERKIPNAWHLAALQDEPKIYLQYLPATDGHMARYAQWSLRQNGINGEVNGATLAHPLKHKEPRRIQLLAWASAKFGIDNWERSPFGSWHPAGTLDRAKQIGG